jgi:non-lysosomal glucosylceramidase
MSTSCASTLPDPIPKLAWRRPIGVVPSDPAVNKETVGPRLDDGPLAAAPLGGFGTGTFSRTIRGDAARWHLAQGQHLYRPMWANQFSLFVQPEGGEPDARVLCTAAPKDDSLSGWRWGWPEGAGEVAGLYPLSFYRYRRHDSPVEATLTQFSPVIPHNYRETGWPVAVFDWRLENRGARAVTVGLMLTWENMSGYLPPKGRWGNGEGNINRGFDAPYGAENKAWGVLMTSPGMVTQAGQGSMAIAAEGRPGVQVTSHARFQADGHGVGLWRAFSERGYLEDAEDDRPAADGERIAGAVAITVTLAPGAHTNVAFSLAWDWPLTQFAADEDPWRKWYTREWGTSGQSAALLATTALDRRRGWRAAIDAFQRPVLEDPRVWDWLKPALFNELYILADAGSAWVTGRLHGDDLPYPGRFTWLESFDYRFYDTLDVRFYGAEPLAQFWPELERQALLTFADTVPREDPSQRHIGSRDDDSTAPRKVAGALPHDLGAPWESPWERVNAYTWRDVTHWKDLAPKFVLQVWRLYHIGGQQDHALLEACIDGVREALAHVEAYDTDGDGLPEHAGVDQTYDNWPMRGASAYVGGLWIAALDAAARMEEALGEADNARAWAERRDRARAAWNDKLWEPRGWFRYDERSDLVMADQLAGQWAARAWGLESLAEDTRIREALWTIDRLNVRGFAGASRGAVNGMTPSGVHVDNEQAGEVWSGVSYTLSALMVWEGLTEEAQRVARGVVNTVWGLDKGLWYRTPEAWNARGDFRASIYMRPAAIWAIWRALTAPQRTTK